MRLLMLFFIVTYPGFLFAHEKSADSKLPNLEITQIDEGAFLHKSYSQVEGWGLVSSNGLIVVDNNSAFVVDTPWSERDTAKLVNWIKAKNYTLLGSMSTHSHEDRTAGIKWLNNHSIPTYATKLTNELLIKENKTPAIHAMSGTEFSLANGLVEVFYPGGGHTIDNVVVWLPKSNILYGGCFVRSLKSGSLGYTGEAHIEQWPKSVTKVMARYPNAKIVVPGHGSKGDTMLLTHTKALATQEFEKRRKASL